MRLSHLNEPALVLNKGWSLVTVTTAADALCKLYQGVAYVIRDEDYSIYDFQSWAARPVDEGRPFIRTPTLHLQVPEVILLARYDRIPRRDVAFSRCQVFRRDKYHCQYCGQRLSRDHITLDHVMPRSRGGASNWTNCVSSCATCNIRKGNRTPHEAGMRLLRIPIKPTWSPESLLQQYQRPKASWSRFVRHFPTAERR